MTTDRDVMQQALEALEAGPGVDPIFAGEVETALRARLAEPEPELVAWRVMLPDGYQFVYDERMLRVIDESIHATRQPLYTTPPTRRPLTDEEILRLLRPTVWAHVEGHNRTQMLADARAIERAHKITGGNDE